MPNNSSSISSVFLHYKQRLAHHIRHIVHPQDIDDIVQDTFVKSYEAELKHSIEFPKTYMLRTVRNLALNHVQSWSKLYTDNIEDGDFLNNHLHTRPLEQEFESKERFLCFCRAVEQLPEQCRKVFILKKVYGLSQQEIASYLKLSESTIEKHIAKGIRRCYEYMNTHEQSGTSATVSLNQKQQSQQA
jgi:RNA polymerase sigma-70 factor (ECF subfamily)